MVSSVGSHSKDQAVDAIRGHLSAHCTNFKREIARSGCYSAVLFSCLACMHLHVAEEKPGLGPKHRTFAPLREGHSPPLRRAQSKVVCDITACVCLLLCDLQGVQASTTFTMPEGWW